MKKTTMSHYIYKLRCSREEEGVEIGQIRRYIIYGRFLIQYRRNTFISILQTCNQYIIAFITTSKSSGRFWDRKK